MALRNFNHDAASRVLVMSLKAGGVGLNLQTANHMIIMDRWWNPGIVFIRERKPKALILNNYLCIATMDQAIARIHRMTQFKQVYIHTVVIKDTIEEGLMDNVLMKKVYISIVYIVSGNIDHSDRFLE
jgi:SNF2 family DNA or RNA helicase